MVGIRCGDLVERAAVVIGADGRSSRVAKDVGAVDEQRGGRVPRVSHAPSAMSGVCVSASHVEKFRMFGQAKLQEYSGSSEPYPEVSGDPNQYWLNVATVALPRRTPIRPKPSCRRLW